MANQPTKQITSDIKLLAPVPVAAMSKYNLKKVPVTDRRKPFVPPFSVVVGASLPIVETQNCTVSLKYQSVGDYGDHYGYVFNLHLLSVTEGSGDIYFKIKNYAGMSPQYTNQVGTDYWKYEADTITADITMTRISKVGTPAYAVPNVLYDVPFALNFNKVVGGYGYSIPEPFYPFVASMFGNQNLTIDGKDVTVWSLVGLDSVDIDSLMFPQGEVQSPTFAIDSPDFLYYAKNY